MGRLRKSKISLEHLVKRFGRPVAAIVFGTALAGGGPAAAFGGSDQQCCGWHYSGNYSYSCACESYPERYGYVYEPEAAGASLLIVPLAASLLSAPPWTGNHCVASGVTCLLPEPAWAGDECFCRGNGGQIQGFVQ